VEGKKEGREGVSGSSSGLRREREEGKRKGGRSRRHSFLSLVFLHDKKRKVRARSPQRKGRQRGKKGRGGQDLVFFRSVLVKKKKKEGATAVGTLRIWQKRGSRDGCHTVIPASLPSHDRGKKKGRFFSGRGEGRKEKKKGLHNITFFLQEREMNPFRTLREGKKRKRKGGGRVGRIRIHFYPEAGKGKLESSRGREGEERKPETTRSPLTEEERRKRKGKVLKRSEKGKKKGGENQHLSFLVTSPRRKGGKNSRSPHRGKKKKEKEKDCSASHQLS